ncbi:MAG TPA: hypothetical protein VJB41_01260 [Patescibacteria group bacterium]|nr:hypothetical protein [Patescibacteria group bacterium]
MPPKFKKTLVVLILFGLLFANTPVLADFDPNYIISDEDLLAYDSMSLSQIQQFLENKRSGLAWYSAIDTDGVNRPASEIIWRAAQTNRINPKVILVTLQKEQSLIQTTRPNQYQLDWATGYGVCDSCNVLDPTLQKYKGFAKQVDGTAGWKRWYLDNATILSWLKQPGQAYAIDTYTVIPANLATASFYTYTPHYHGNYNFWKIWGEWFGTIYPDGTVIKEIDGAGIWLLQRGQKRQFLTYSAFSSRYSPDKLVSVLKSDLDDYETGVPIKFSDFSVLKSPAGIIYLIVGDERRAFSSAEVFRVVGINPEEIIEVSQAEIDAYIEGKQISLESVYPLGSLLQNKTTGGVYLVENGLKKPIWGKEFLTLYYKDKKITAVSPEELDKYPTAEPIKFEDGELVVAPGSPTVYIISNGEKRAIPTEQVFNQLGYKWKNIIKTTDKILTLHPLGSPIYVGAGAVETTAR